MIESTDLTRAWEWAESNQFSDWLADLYVNACATVGHIEDSPMEYRGDGLKAYNAAYKCRDSLCRIVIKERFDQ